MTQEKKEIDRYTNNLTKEIDISRFQSDKEKIEKIQDDILKKLNEESQNQSICNYSNLLDYKSNKSKVVFKELLDFKELSKKTNQENIYPVYCRLSQSVHANHAALWLYKDKESIVEKDWHTPLYVCYYTLANSASIYLKRYSDNFDEYLISEKSKEVKKALDNLTSQ